MTTVISGGGYILEMADSTSSYLSPYRSRFKIIQLIAMETWNQSYFLALLHYLDAGFGFEEIFLAENINELRVYFFGLHCFMDRRDL